MRLKRLKAQNVMNMRICDPTPSTATGETCKDRVALARMLIWAAHEATELGCDAAAAHLVAALRTVKKERA